MIAAALKDYPRLSVRGLYELVGVDRSWYHQKSAAEDVAQRDVGLRDAIERIVLEFPGYGYRRVTGQLHREEWDVDHKRVLRVMREESLLCQIERRFVVTTDSGHSLRTYPNQLTGSASGGWMRPGSPTSRMCGWRRHSRPTKRRS